MRSDKRVRNMIYAVRSEIPLASQLMSSLVRVDYWDCYMAESKLAERSLVDIYAAAFGHLPTLFKHLLVIRSALVKPFGIAGVSYKDLTRTIDTNRAYEVGEKIGLWTIFEKTDNELIAGTNDKHLDFRVSVFRDGRTRVALSTCVMTHNAFGRAYLTTILPFHRFGVMKLLTDASAVRS